MKMSLVGGVAEEVFLRVNGLTGTNLQYHLLGDLMVDHEWTRRESGTSIITQRQKEKCAVISKTGRKMIYIFKSTD